MDFLPCLGQPQLASLTYLWDLENGYSQNGDMFRFIAAHMISQADSLGNIIIQPDTIQDFIDEQPRRGDSRFWRKLLNEFTPVEHRGHSVWHINLALINQRNRWINEHLALRWTSDEILMTPGLRRGQFASHRIGDSSHYRGLFGTLPEDVSSMEHLLETEGVGAAYKAAGLHDWRQLALFVANVQPVHRESADILTILTKEWFKEEAVFEVGLNRLAVLGYEPTAAEVKQNLSLFDSPNELVEITVEGNALRGRLTPLGLASVKRFLASSYPQEG